MAASAAGSLVRRAGEAGLGLLALAASVALFVVMGASVPASTSPAPASDAAVGGHDLHSLAQRLQARLGDASGPAAAQDWALLARSHAALGEHERADAAYARALAAAPQDATLLAEHAQLQVLRGARADAAPVRALVDAALAADAQQPLALALRGDAAYERGELAQARAHWQAAAVRVSAGDDALAAALAQRVALLDEAQQAFVRALGTPAPAAPQPGTTPQR